MEHTRDEDVNSVPDIIYDSHTRTQYKKGRFFGKGGFAKCYEITNTLTNHTFAGKIVSKKLMAKQNQKEKNDPGDTDSPIDTSQKWKALTEPETRYYMKQILNGVNYLHSNRIIHRDLKLGNLFLNDELVVKIGDFGLAAKIEYDGERKKTLCGTPNYIAPEILNKKGHSFEVDIWSMGCIMYTLLIGRPPFETNSLKETYSRIKKCDYRISSNISASAKHMIMLMLQPEPTSRPTCDQLLRHDFILGYCPANLPVSCLTMAPRFDNLEISSRKPLIELNNAEATLISPHKKHDSIAAGLVLKSKPARPHKFLDEMSDPAAQPMVWVSKWVDYSDKYGFGYQLSDEGVGVMFNDTTKLIMLPNGINVHYVDKNGDESYMTVDNYPRQYDKKMKLLSYFSRYMREHLIKTGASVVKEIDSMSRTPHLHQWCRSTSGVLMQLNNGTVQVSAI
ncbi:hypothetical protein NQ314_010878 [Rhamnusium bicolor]|uniref:polo kinase n=1 Tax=Rhamnusium bicolor TaxID=1586634 RepID=A0AAV8XN68_9CUCU|nr:hypothetical protein NQ314_010878 [Rhamnusium bicolor]